MGVWKATVRSVTRVGQDSETEPPPPPRGVLAFAFSLWEVIHVPWTVLPERGFVFV